MTFPKFCSYVIGVAIDRACLHEIFQQDITIPEILLSKLVLLL